LYAPKHESTRSLYEGGGYHLPPPGERSCCSLLAWEWWQAALKSPVSGLVPITVQAKGQAATDGSSVHVRAARSLAKGDLMSRMSVRAGCVVLSFDVCSLADAGRPKEDSAQELGQRIVETVKRWSRGRELEMPGWEEAVALISVQVGAGLLCVCV